MLTLSSKNKELACLRAKLNNQVSLCSPFLLSQGYSRTVMNVSYFFAKRRASQLSREVTKAGPKYNIMNKYKYKKVNPLGSPILFIPSYTPVSI